jgi:hypothetical protein
MRQHLLLKVKILVNALESIDCADQGTSKKDSTKSDRCQLQYLTSQASSAWDNEKTLIPETIERWRNAVELPTQGEVKVEYTCSVEDDTSDDESQEPGLLKSQPLINVHSLGEAGIWKQVWERKGPENNSRAKEEESTQRERLYGDLAGRDDIVTLPHLGTFQVKKGFRSLASTQLIRKMLSQCMPCSG